MTTYTILIVTLICFLSSQLSLTHQANVSPHHHKHSGGEREADGAFSPRDHSHFNGEEHDFDFDHEAILGSTKDAEEFDHLPPEEAKKRLAVLLLKMDSNSDKAITAAELKQWILRSFKSLSEEESKEKFDEADKDKDGKVTWAEYRAETYGVENEEESNIFSGKEHDEEQRLMKNDRELFDSADLNNDGQLDPKEFLSFTHPEEAPHMLDVILKQTLEEKDTNKNGFVDFKEYIGDRDSTPELAKQKEMFDSEFDTNGDGHLDSTEFKRWVAPSNEEIADEEVEHLFASADDDHDGTLSFDEILLHHDVFVGSEATDYGDHLNNLHRFQDEL